MRVVQNVHGWEVDMPSEKAEIRKAVNGTLLTRVPAKMSITTFAGSRETSGFVMMNFPPKFVIQPEDAVSLCVAYGKFFLSGQPAVGIPVYTGEEK